MYGADNRWIAPEILRAMKGGRKSIEPHWAVEELGTIETWVF